MKDFDKIDIHELLPQQEPFVMVGKFLYFDMDRTVTGYTVAEENIFVEEGVFSDSGIIENIAQTCAARIGYVNKYIFKKSIQLGFIGAIRNLHINRRPRVGEYIETTILTLEEVFGMTLVKAEMRVGNDLIADAEMKIALSDIESSGSDSRE